MTHTFYHGDCLQVMPTLEANSVDTIVTDPPYGLSFMGKDWDHGVPGVAFWSEALRVAKPGAMLLAFGGTRTFHRLTCAIEDAGWEVRDVVTWLYGSGFPKSHDISKAIDKAAGAERETVGPRIYADGKPRKQGANDTFHEGWQRPWRIDDPQRAERLTAPATDAARTWHGWGTALKPAWEPIVLAMKPLDGTFADNALRWGVAGLNVDGARIGVAADEPNIRNNGAIRQRAQTQNTYGEYKAVDRAPTLQAGRWPANLLLDEDAAAALDAQSGVTVSKRADRGKGIDGPTFKNANGQLNGVRGHDDSGGCSRFFYVAKASRAERNAGLEGMEARQELIGAAGHKINPMTGKPVVDIPRQNHHPTVKPLALMRYLCRLTSTPTGGVVLDPFMGSGTTGVACAMEGRHFIGVELDAGYFDIARKRIESVQPALMEAAD